MTQAGEGRQSGQAYGIHGRIRWIGAHHAASKEVITAMRATGRSLSSNEILYGVSSQGIAARSATNGELVGIAISYRKAWDRTNSGKWLATISIARASNLRSAEPRIERGLQLEQLQRPSK
ncbi:MULTISPECIES: hypothetical protein [Rhizobium]|uniref:hypothetical protein n=1 Tax=Rhizobium TaxID=379 RepID=UPI00195C2116|nr:MULTISPECIES: hypothetical protein [Rhizobium]MBM7047472.1 hypothetical protein [Rhizobium lusitanum]